MSLLLKLLLFWLSQKVIGDVMISPCLELNVTDFVKDSSNNKNTIKKNDQGAIDDSNEELVVVKLAPTQVEELQELLTPLVIEI